MSINGYMSVFMCGVCVCVCVYTHASSVVAQTVKNLPAMQEIWVWSLDWEDPLEKGMATCSSIFFFFQCYSSILSLQYSCLENSRDRGAWWATGSCNESDTTEWLTLSSIEKEGNSAIWDNMNGPWGHYAKGNTSDRKRQFMISIICGI